MFYHVAGLGGGRLDVIFSVSVLTAGRSTRLALPEGCFSRALRTVQVVTTIAAAAEEPGAEDGAAGAVRTSGRGKGHVVDIWNTACHVSTRGELV